MTAPVRSQSASAEDRLAGLFPDPSTPSAPWWGRRSRITVAVVIVVVLIASTALAARAFGSDSPQYVTATVGQHNVNALLSGVATIEPVSQATVAFPVAGTVSAVDVALGDSVVIGQTLASLDTQSLTDTLHDKEVSLAQAELTLTKALNGEAVGGVNSGAASSGSSRSAKTASFTTTSADTSSSSRIVLIAATSTGSGDAELVAAQQAVLSAQKNVDAALSAANDALDAAATVCAAAGIDTTGTPTTSTTTPTAEELTACQTATKDVLTAQTTVSTAQKALAGASNALDALLTQRATARATSGTTPGTGSTPSASGQTGSGQTGSASSSPSSADLIAYQKAVDAAAAQVAVAQQAVAQATIASPIAGKVVGVNLAVGDTVTSASTTQNIIVVGDGGFEAVTTVGIAKLPAVKVGQPATVIPDGSAKPLDGTVVSIAGTPDSSATSTSYQVVIALSTEDSQQAAAAGLHNGSTGSIAIVTKRAASVLSVPTSAVTTTGTQHTVTVLDGSTSKQVTVGIGVVGDTWTEITSGVNAGRQVVLANLGEPLPGSATQSSTTSNQRGTTGGFPTGLFPGGSGGFTGGGGGGGGGGFTGGGRGS
jgi:multidrug efflux pump subunit AcrA (membrane-fusion protein)